MFCLFILKIENGIDFLISSLVVFLSWNFDTLKNNYSSFWGFISLKRSIKVLLLSANFYALLSFCSLIALIRPCEAMWNKWWRCHLFYDPNLRKQSFRFSPFNSVWAASCYACSLSCWVTFLLQLLWSVLSRRGADFVIILSASTGML